MNVLFARSELSTYLSVKTISGDPLPTPVEKRGIPVGSQYQVYSYIPVAVGTSWLEIARKAGQNMKGNMLLKLSLSFL